MHVRRFLVVASAGFWLISAAWSPAAEPLTGFADLQESEAVFGSKVRPFLAKHCAACHGGETQEADLNLERLAADMKASPSAARWAMVHEKLRSGEMPPEEEPRPQGAEVESVLLWIKREMKRAGKHLARREAYANGNAVPHDLLFGKGQAAPFASQTRVRRLSPPIYEAFTGDLGKGVNGIGQPFSPNANTTFADMNAPKIDEPITVQLIRNALLIVGKQTSTREDQGEVKWTGAREFEPLFRGDAPTAEEIKQAFEKQFREAVHRGPTDEEAERFAALYSRSVQESGREIGGRYALAAVFLLPEAVYRFEHGATESSAGRRRLTPREIALAINYALADRRPPSWLIQAADEGELDTDAGVAAMIDRCFEDPKFQRPRVLRFFREYFDYRKADQVFKDREYNDFDARVLIADTDRLVEHILERDREVLQELLTTNEAFVAYRTAADDKKKRAEALKKFLAQKKKNPEKYKDKQPKLPGREIFRAYSLADFPDEQPTKLPRSERAGILTQPAWLIAFSTAEDNHAILRGKWVRERLLGGVVPDIPITVDAQLPNAPEQTLRQRMAVTEQQYCWKCHQLMNPVGLPFEIYDHVGRYRKWAKVLDPAATEKNVDKKGKPLGPVMREVLIDASGRIDGTDAPRVHGDVQDAVEMLHRLAESEYVEQVFVRHAFRYWMGRNENLGDGPSLQAAHRAYRDNGGSMRALIKAILTSESFLYRVPSESPVTDN